MTDEPSIPDYKVIPESLLAFAKDSRYLKECQDLILKCVQPYVRDTDHWVPTAELASSLLYIVLVLMRKRRTAGMEISGIEYSDKIPRARLFIGSCVSAIASYFFKRAGQSSRSSLENLSGAQRRQIFEQQRTDMLRRAGEDAPQPLPNSSVSEGRRVLSSTRTSKIDCIQAFARSISEFLHQDVTTFGSSGPHLIPDIAQGTRTRSLVDWLVRFHLALYCMNGNYPSFLHRIFHREPLQFEAGKKALVNRPTTIRVVGFLIFAQTSGLILQTISRKMMYWWVDSQSHSSAGPTVHIEGKPAVPIDDSTANGIVSCSICQQPRQYPACSANCGHVFCWHCLQQWVTSNAAACPLCRKDSASQDVVLLRNY